MIHIHDPKRPVPSLEDELRTSRRRSRYAAILLLLVLGAMMLYLILEVR